MVVKDKDFKRALKKKNHPSFWINDSECLGTSTSMIKFTVSVTEHFHSRFCSTSSRIPFQYKARDMNPIV